MALDDARYVSVVTFRRTGDPVATAVWWAPLGDGTFGFTTASDSGKVKRLAHTDRVLLRPCDRAGRVDPGAPEVTGTARFVAAGADLDRVKRAVTDRYGLQARVVTLGGKLRALVKRGRVSTAAVIVTPSEP